MQYTNSNIHLFKCLWFYVQNCTLGYQVGKYGITIVNINWSLPLDEPFILACQAKQVFYIEDIKDATWAIVIKTQPRDLFSMQNVPSANHESHLPIPTNDEEY